MGGINGNYLLNSLGRLTEADGLRWRVAFANLLGAPRLMGRPVFLRLGGRVKWGGFLLRHLGNLSLRYPLGGR